MKVNVISRNGNSALIECSLDGVLSRKFIPVSELEGDIVSETVCKQGIPYGYPWQEIDIQFDGDKFAEEMHNVGLWTANDIMKSPQKLWSALHATLADNLSEIIEKAKQEQKRSTNK
jgi:hypothetical protein